MTKQFSSGKHIRAMFNRIAPRYDFLNRLLSCGIDRSWRRRAAAALSCPEEGMVLDIATGTADMALATAETTAETCRIIGVDFSEAMLHLADKKIAASPYRDRISLSAACCEALPFRPETFHAAVIAFGIRNVPDRLAGLSEIQRILRPGGRLVILELTTPRPGLIRNLYYGYFRGILPALGRFFSDGSAYRYLPESVMAFPDSETFANIIAAAGFTAIRHQRLTLGIVTLFTADKPLTPS